MEETLHAFTVCTPVFAQFKCAAVHAFLRPCLQLIGSLTTYCGSIRTMHSVSIILMKAGELQGRQPPFSAYCLFPLAMARSESQSTQR